MVLLLSDSVVVHSPIYGEKSVEDFYTGPSKDTGESKLILNGIFEEPNSNRVAVKKRREG